MLEGIVAIIVAFLTGGVAKHLFDWLKARNKRMSLESIDNFSVLFDNIHKVYNILNHLKFYTGAKRVLIVKVEDSGGIPSVADPLHSTVLYEVFEQPLPSLKSFWQRVRVGEVYIRNTQHLYEDGTVSYKVEELLDSEIKDLHLEKKTKYIQNYFLISTKKYFLYLSIQFHVYQEEQDSIYRNSVRINADKLKQLLNPDTHVEIDEDPEG